MHGMENCVIQIKNVLVAMVMCAVNCVRRRTMRKMLIGWTLGAFAVSGCALTRGGNGYSDFYKAETWATPGAIAEMRAGPVAVSPRVDPVPKWDESIASVYARQGYVLIGSSAFTSGRPEPDQDAITLGTQVGADLVVILSPEYKGTVTTSVPITTPSSTTSYTNGTATAYGAGSPMMAYGNSTTTTYGTSTSYIPITVQRSGYAADYFVKKRYRFGANYRDLTDSERQQLQTNRGVYVSTIVDNSPAYNSDILPGDAIVSVNEHAPSGAAGFSELLNENRGRTVNITVIRAGKTLSKSVAILE